MMMERWRFFIRGSMLLFWALVFWAFLYMPRLKNMFAQERSIAILAWPSSLDTATIHAFEKETGIRVYVNYFEGYEEFFIKLKTAHGEGYDLVTPADYIVPSLIDEGLLKKIDRTKLSFFSRLRPNLIGLYYDQDNSYTIPYFWGMYGIGYNKRYFSQGAPEETWALAFDPLRMPRGVGMLDDARESILIAAQYLFGSIEGLDAQKLVHIKKTLLAQKKRLLAYTDTRAPYFLVSGSSPLVIGLGYDIARVMRVYSHIGFFIPREGSFLLIDNFAIPAASGKEALVYQFLEYLYKKENLAALVTKNLFFPPTVDVDASVYMPFPKSEQLAHAEYFKNVVPKYALNDIWISLKA